jgi:fructose-1,6-bisphosphatase I
MSIDILEASIEMPETSMLGSENLVTLQSFILAEARRHPEATGTFSWILSALSLSAKIISSKIRRARLENVLGDLESDNVQGERQQKLDVISNEVLIKCLGSRSGVAIVASEEDEEPTILRPDTDGEQRYCVLFDPLDGSSNLDICGGVGTIFSILHHKPNGGGAESSVLQAGTEQVAAGYVLYGSSTVFVLTTGSGVHMFVLDPGVGAFLLVEQDLQVPKTGKIYSVNEGNRKSFSQGFQDYLDWAQDNGYSARYAGAMVADVHRTLLKGGVFMYPPTTKAPKGKLRLMYEANPMAMLMEQAGGKATTGEGRIVEVVPEAVHQRVPVIMGSADEVDHVLSRIQ